MLSYWRNKGYHLNYGEECILNFSKIIKPSFSQKIKILDIGSDHDRDLRIISNEINSHDNELYAISDKAVSGILTSNVDVENEKLPYNDNYFQITICNQVFEHLKNWMWSFHEQIRVTKKDGWVIVGFPNLAALHCRFQLAIGHHPSCIKLDDAHVRGFTKNGFYNIIEKIDGLSIEKFSGSNMYGFPPNTAKILGKTFPNFAVSIFFLIKKNKPNVNVIELIKSKKLQTTYFTGN